MAEPASSGGGGYLLPGVSAPCLLRGGVCVCARGVCSGGGGGGGVCSRGSVLGCVVSQHALRQTPPVDRITDAC